MHYEYLWVEGKLRRFLLLVPAGEGPFPLWLLAPGTRDAPETVLEMSGLEEFAKHKRFALAVVAGDQNVLAVGPHAQRLDGWPDDVDYARAVLREVAQLVCVDQRRVYCVGFSRGGRYCAMLASELPGTLAAIAPVASLRFPEPNNASGPMAVIAFHGTADPVNPFEGRGRSYWHESVPWAAARWAEFNGCVQGEVERLSPHVVVERFMSCVPGGDVALVRVENGGHTWPGSSYLFDLKTAGLVTTEISANELIWAFFMMHMLPEASELSTVTERKAEATLPVVDEGRLHHASPQQDVPSSSPRSSLALLAVVGALPAAGLAAWVLNGWPGQAAAARRAAASTELLGPLG